MGVGYCSGCGNWLEGAPCGWCLKERVERLERAVFPLEIPPQKPKGSKR